MTIQTHIQITAQAVAETMAIERKRAAVEIERLQELLRDVGANRYWEGRWRDERVEIERLLEILRAIDHTLSVHGHIDANTPLHERIKGATGNAAMAEDALEQKAEDR